MMTRTNADFFKEHADRMGMPLRSLGQVQDTIAHCKTRDAGCDVAAARLMLRHGRLTDEARAWVAKEYPL